MTKLILIFLTCLCLTGCSSILPRITHDTPNTVPQSVDKSKNKEICKGKVEFFEDGSVKYCERGYYNYAENYVKIERKMTLVERIKSFINGLIGWGFWIFVAIVIFAPGLLGLLLGRLLEGLYGMAATVNKRLIKAIQKTKNESKDLASSLEAELDAVHKKYITAVKQQEGLK